MAEGNLAAGLAEALSLPVEKLIVDNPRWNAGRKPGNQGEPSEALRFAPRRRAGLLVAVQQTPLSRFTLKELGRS